VQFASQPSPLTVLPSSHCSVPSTMPSPHTWAGTQLNSPMIGRENVFTDGQVAICPAVSGQFGSGVVDE
jgi:hypothetical protein